MKPKLQLTSEQSAALSVLGPNLGASTYLAGGVAAGLYFGHRRSHDLDLFTADGADVEQADRALVGHSDIAVTGRAAGTLYLEVCGMPATVMRYSYPSLSEPVVCDGVPVRIVSIEDLAAMKLSAISARGALRDFWDLHEILSSTRWTLPEVLEAYQRKFQSDDLGHVIRSLVYFDDADNEPRPVGLTEEHWSRVQQDLREWVVRL